MNSATPAVPQAEDPADVPPGEGEHWRWCPRCSAELQNHRCKLVCKRCGYFMSCSDFDVMR